MYILFEEHPYEPHLVKDILAGIYDFQKDDKSVSVPFVGYFYNPQLHDCVFILPKVLLNEQDKLVGMKTKTEEDVAPEDVSTSQGQEYLRDNDRKFIYQFAVWIYRALSVFYKANPNSQAIYYKHLPQAGRGKRNRTETHLDVVLSLMNFYRENRDFVMFTIKNIHRGYNKINWTRTINHSQAFVQNNEVVYLNPVNKKRVVNDEEELFVIFFSILNYLNQEYGFNTPIDFQYELIRGKQFESYLNGVGKTRLRQIKYKYFSDKALQLWDLCYAFFDNEWKLAINTQTQEYILARSFHVVFEAMIDELIGTPHNKIPKGLADQQDGKRVDHLYIDKGLFGDIYYIGDSKYYKPGNQLGDESVYKQFTYARNVIQWRIDLQNEIKGNWKSEQDFNNDQKGEYAKIKVRDDLTEGYNFIPNFFISAYVRSMEYDDGKNIEQRADEKDTYLSYQFPNRLFDRDTHLLSHYDVNFLYVLSLYARNRQSEKLAWQKKVRETIRKKTIVFIDSLFEFATLKPKNEANLKGDIKAHFHTLNGKIYRKDDEGNQIILALEKAPDYLKENLELLSEIEKVFEIYRYDLSTDFGSTPSSSVILEIREFINNLSPTLPLDDCRKQILDFLNQLPSSQNKLLDETDKSELCKEVLSLSKLETCPLIS